MTGVMTLHLVDCEPYGSRLTDSMCATRYRKAQGVGHPLQESSCRRCEAGRERAGGPAVEEPHRYERVEGVEPRRDGRNRAEHYVQCTCGRTPPRWVQRFTSHRGGMACGVCAKERRRAAVDANRLCRKARDMDRLVEMQQADRHERARAERARG